MEEYKIIGRQVSVAAILCIYVLIWIIVREGWYEYTAELYDDWCWEKVLGIFCRIWAYGHIVLIVGGIIAWFIWSWI
nr:hypothetical protein [uncultured Mediterraneibacter sp.]